MLLRWYAGYSMLRDARMTLTMTLLLRHMVKLEQVEDSWPVAADIKNGIADPIR